MAQNEKFNLENQYLMYLKRVNLKINEMHPVQRIQVKQAFYGAVGQMIILMRDDIAPLKLNHVVKVLENMLKQVGDYWTNPENHKQ